MSLQGQRVETRMKTVVCFGDSNTWGAATVPRPDGRYAPEERWTGVLRAALGDGWQVHEEGLNGRTAVSDDPIEFEYDKNGAKALPVVLHTHKPVDVLIIMLGTNDHKIRFAKSPWDIAAGVGVLVQMAKADGAAVGRDGGTPRILVICPPSIHEELGERFADMFAGAPAKSREVPRFYRKMAEELGVEYLDAGTIIESSRFDGFHLDPEAHATLGRKVADILKAGG